MSGHLILRKILAEKEKASGRRQLINACCGLATALTVSSAGYSTLTYLAAQPALSRGPNKGANSANFPALVSAGNRSGNTAASSAGNTSANSAGNRSGNRSGNTAATSAGTTSDLAKSSGNLMIAAKSASSSNANHSSNNAGANDTNATANSKFSNWPSGSIGAKGSGGANGADSFGGSMKSEGPISLLSEPASGVKLLLSIFSRLGNEQIAMLPEAENRWVFKPNTWADKKAKVSKDAEESQQAGQQQHAGGVSQFSQELSSNVADPALSIRPQVKKTAAMDELAYSLPAEKQIMPSQAATLAQAPAPQAAQSERVQSYGRGAQQASWYKANMPVKIVSDSPDIREFGQGNRRDGAIDTRAKVSAKRQVNIIDEPLGRARMEHSNLIETSKDLAAANGNADSVTGIIRPSEQPGLFKYVREYYKEPLKNMPPPTSAPAAPATVPQGMDGSPQVADLRANEDSNDLKKEIGKASNGQALPGGMAGGFAGGGGAASGAKSVSASFDVDKSMKRGYEISNFRAANKARSRAMQIAFLPPNAVHGINGLSLGSSLAETTEFFKGHGKFTKISLSGFQILTLKGDRGATLLQAFVRNERLEALRVFSSTFIPPQLGVSLGENLPNMKAKFGEAAFTLEEPKVKEGAPLVMAKNYVYPVSQVSFQISRRNANTTPEIVSLLLFRFL